MVAKLTDYQRKEIFAINGAVGRNFAVDYQECVDISIVRLSEGESWEVIKADLRSMLRKRYPNHQIKL